MATTLTYGSTTIALSDDMLWVDEFDWQAVAQRRAYTIAGSMIVESAARAAGRPFTLAAGENYGWIPRSTLNALRVAANIPGQTLTLSLRGSTYQVKFDHQSNQAVTARPAVDYSDPSASDYYVATVKLIEV